MKQEDLISTKIFCNSYHISMQTIYTFREYGLIDLVEIEQEEYIDSLKLARLEQLVRLHTELNINPEGLDAISNLLDRIEQLQEEVQALRNRSSSTDDMIYA